MHDFILHSVIVSSYGLGGVVPSSGPQVCLHPCVRLVGAILALVIGFSSLCIIGSFRRRQ